MRRLLPRAHGIATAIVALAILGAPAGTIAERATLDTVDVQRIDDDLVAIRDGASSARIELLKRERVLRLESMGSVGVALTDRRFLAISTNASRWQQYRFGREDAEPTIRLGANLALCLTGHRILHFAGGAGLIGESTLSPAETVASAEVGEHVGAVVTDRRVLGFSSDATAAADRSLFVQETFESLQTRATTATVRTSQRMLVYKRSGGGWAEER
jgi:hypothetical protein